MKYVAKHLTKHHLLHAPHRWFFALLLSPIHAAEIHYQTRYHLQFAHARKLFLFDLTLVGLIFGLTGLATYWFWYDPTIVEQISVTIRASHEQETEEAGRIRSGEKITLAITYQNHSDQELNQTELRVRLPQHFVLQSTAGATFNSSTQSFAIGRVLRKATHTVYATGIFYGTPGADEHVLAEFQYTPSLRAQSESKLAVLITNLRDSVLVSEINIPDRLPANSHTPVSLTLRNNSNTVLPEIIVPFTTGTMVMSAATSQQGTTTANMWRIPGLQPEQSAQLNFSLLTKIPTEVTTATWHNTPLLVLHGVSIPQQTISKTWGVARPQITISSQWLKSKAAAGSTVPLTVNLRNSGSETITNINLQLSLPTTINTARWRNLDNIGLVNNQGVLINAAHNARLRELAPGESVDLTLQIPVATFPTESRVVIPLTVRSTVSGVASEFSSESATPELMIGTALKVKAEARYYTAEGDQLGRGPLPPQVGKETKYALLLYLTNAGGEATNVQLRAQLPRTVRWTGKTSVSRGQDLNFDPSTNQISWSAHTLPAKAELSAYAEVAITPTESERGRVLTLLQGITVQGTDVVLEAPLQATAPALTSALLTDPLAQIAGTLVR